MRKETPFKLGNKEVFQIHTGTWLNYTVDVKTSGLYRVELEYSSACKADNKLEMSVDGRHAGTFDCPAPKPALWATSLKAKPFTVRLEAGRHVLNLMVAGYLSMSSLDFTLVEQK